MLPKSKRFTKEDFQGKRPKVFFRSDIVDIAGLSLHIQKFACITSKKTLKRAVDRNHIKRRIFSVVQELPKIKDLSLVFYPKKVSITLSYSQLREEIQKAFATLH